MRCYRASIVFVVCLCCCWPSLFFIGTCHACLQNFTRCGSADAHDLSHTPSLCNPIYDYSTDSIAFLNDSSSATQTFVGNFRDGIQILKNFSSGIYFDDYDDPHISIQYLCCYSAEEYAKIVAIIKSITWSPIQVTYGPLTCNQNGDGHVSLIVPLDPPSQIRMMSFVKQIEDAMTANGIAVHRSRSEQEFFHTTMADALPSYPAADAIDKVNSLIPNFSPHPISITNFWLLIPPAHFVSNGTQFS